MHWFYFSNVSVVCIVISIALRLLVLFPLCMFSEYLYVKCCLDQRDEWAQSSYFHGISIPVTKCIKGHEESIEILKYPPKSLYHPCLLLIHTLNASPFSQSGTCALSIFSFSYSFWALICSPGSKVPDQQTKGGDAMM